MGGSLHPHPVTIPPRLLAAFEHLGASPVLVGGTAVQVWTGLSDGLFQTFDLDFITSLRASDFIRAGLEMEPSGRHLLVDGRPVEFPSGPLAVGDLQLDAINDTRMVPTVDGGAVRCLRPEACVLDRLAQVAAWQVAEAYPQAMAIAIAQSGQPGWDNGWMDRASMEAGLSKQWNHLRSELDRDALDERGLDEAMDLGWD